MVLCARARALRSIQPLIVVFSLNNKRFSRFQTSVMSGVTIFVPASVTPPVHPTQGHSELRLRFPKGPSRNGPIWWGCIAMGNLVLCPNGYPTVGNYCTRLSYCQKMSNDGQKGFRHVGTDKMNNFFYIEIRVKIVRRCHTDKRSFSVNH